MITFRLTSKKYLNDISGKGAELHGGRWNSKGIRILYTSANIALCTAEVAVHLPLGILPENYILQHIEFPSKKVKVLNESDLPKNWNKFPYDSKSRIIGDQFIDNNKFLILKLPSAVVPGEYNYLINPFHNLFKEVKLIKTEDYDFDKRLFIR